jgi:hypothetical protein
VVMRVGGMDLLVETTPVAGTEPTSGKKLERAQEAVADAFDRAQSAIVAVAESTVRTIGQLGSRSVHPDEMQVTFGLKFSAQGNVIVAGAAGEATLEVALTYRRAPGGADMVGGASPTTPVGETADGADAATAAGETGGNGD